MGGARGVRGREAQTLERARAAFRAGSWSEACAAFAALDPASLDRFDLHDYADAEWWLAHLDRSIELRSLAHAAHLAAGDIHRAAYAAWFLAYDHRVKGEAAVGIGWLKRGRTLLAGSADSAELALIEATEAEIALGRGAIEQARAHAEEALRIARAAASPEATAIALHKVGESRIAMGEPDDGFALLDEAMTSAATGELNEMFTGFIYCMVLGTCWAVPDVARAAAWSEVVRSWYERSAETTVFHGLCLVHRAELTILQGAWDEAAADTQRAGELMRSMEPRIAAEAYYANGEVHRRRGDLAAAEAAFARAHELGRDPQPGLALIRLAQGKREAAAASLRTALAAGGDGLGRARLLDARIQVCLAAGDHEGARDAASELTGLAAASPSALLAAMAAHAEAAVRHATGDATGALASAGRAQVIWRELRLPYEAARTQLVAGLAARASGDEEGGEREIAAAREAFERLGAALDARAAAGLVTPAEPPGGLSGREMEVLRLVAAGKTNREIATALVLSEHTVSRHLQNIFRKLEVSSRAAATAYAFEHALV